jgi:hypothetical protein
MANGSALRRAGTWIVHSATIAVASVAALMIAFGAHPGMALDVFTVVLALEIPAALCTVIAGHAPGRGGASVSELPPSPPPVFAAHL